MEDGTTSNETICPICHRKVSRHTREEAIKCAYTNVTEVTCNGTYWANYCNPNYPQMS